MDDAEQFIANLFTGFARKKDLLGISNGFTSKRYLCELRKINKPEFTQYHILARWGLRLHLIRLLLSGAG